MDTRRFRAIPLTPIHVGTGSRLAPEDYFNDGNLLIQFRPSLVIARMSPVERAQYEAHLDSGNMREALTQLRGRAKRDESTWVSRVVMGAAARQDLLGILTDPGRRRGEIMPLPRNELRGEVTLPGSAIKGAIRTALLNAFVRWRESQEPGFTAGWSADIRAAQSRDLSRLAQELEAKSFGYEPGRMESDLFRLVRVKDTRVDSSQIRIDRLQIVRRDGNQANEEGIRMYAERLASAVDGTDAGFDLEISLDVQKIRHQKVADLFQAGLNWEFLLASLSFFRERFDAEAASFPRLYGPGVFTQQVMQTFGTNPLLRIGRFSHFESLSVDGLRRGENRITHQPIYGMGGSRTVCQINSNAFAPFGWLVLVPLQ